MGGQYSDRLEEIGQEAMDWIHLAQNKNRRWAPVQGNEPSLQWLGSYLLLKDTSLYI
jgi:hypothetical protein